MAWSSQSPLSASAILPSAHYNQGISNDDALYAGLQPVQFSMIFDGGGATVAASTKLGFYYNLPTMTITKWDIGEISTTPSAACAIFDIWTCAPSVVGTVASGNSIIGSGSKLVITTCFRNGASPVGWTTTCIVQGDYVFVRVFGVSSGAKLAVTLYGTRAI
jgi:hypothetical protein